MTINIDEMTDVEKYDFDFGYEEVAKKVIEKAVDYVNCPYEVAVNLELADNEQVRNINYEQRNIDSATDVLSFPMVEYEVAGDFAFLENDDMGYFDPDSGELMLGDIVISCDRVVSQASEYGHDKKREFAFLIAHSMFHLFGYDHMTEEEAERMFAMQEEVLHSLGIER